jgi:pimeloyl-ACP methyl ester carboxylesterase
MDQFSRSGLLFDVIDAGPPDGDGVILLHGFPETSASWSAVSPALTAAGLRVLAPDQRGYSPGARPTGRRAYAMGELVADVIALADRAGLDQFDVVGHDWGGAVAWSLATMHPDRLRTLTSLSTPHPEAMLRAMVSSTQLLHSWYMLMFQLPRVPERMLLARDGLAFKRSMGQAGLAADAVERYYQHLRQPGALTAALNWYRALPFSATDRQRTPITVPTMYVWSTNDVALGRAAAERTARYVSGPYRFEVLDGVSHWIPEEVPDEIARLLLDHTGHTV